MKKPIIAVIDNAKCRRCGCCVKFCGINAIEFIDGQIFISDKCIGCRVCVDNCPFDAIRALTK